MNLLVLPRNFMQLKWRISWAGWSRSEKDKAGQGHRRNPYLQSDSAVQNVEVVREEEICWHWCWCSKHEKLSILTLYWSKHPCLDQYRVRMTPAKLKTIWSRQLGLNKSSVNFPGTVLCVLDSMCPGPMCPVLFVSRVLCGHPLTKLSQPNNNSVEQK